MKAYLAVKFKQDGSNRELIEQLSNALGRAGISTSVFFRDYEKWGQVKFDPQELMRLAHKATDECDVAIIEFSEKGVGLGIEAGYAFAKGKPVHVIARVGSEISDTLSGIASSITFYDSPESLDARAIFGR
jgi:nucleoside 2-deoxyribosyltransferase